MLVPAMVFVLVSGSHVTAMFINGGLTIGVCINATSESTPHVPPGDGLMPMTGVH